MIADRNAWTLTRETADLRRPTMPSKPVTFDAQPQQLTIDLARTAVVVVDLQNDFCHPDGWLAGIGVGISGAQAPIPVVAGLLPRLRTHDVPVVWVNWGNRPDQANLPPGVRHVYDAAGEGTGIGSTSGPSGSPVLQAGSWAAAIVDDLDVEAGDVTIDKCRMSGFVDTPLDSILRNLRVDTLLFCGVNADQCVLNTLTDAANLGYDVIMIEDAVGTTSPPYCLDATFYNVRQCYGFTTTSRSVTQGLGAN